MSGAASDSRHTHLSDANSPAPRGHSIMKTRFQRFAILAFACIMQVESPVEAQILRRRVPARRVCCLKDYGYSTDHLSAPETVTSFPALPQVGVDPTLPVNRPYQSSDYRTFSFTSSELRNDHCRLSNLSFVMSRDGQWVLSFRAEQNPDLVEDVDRPQSLRFVQNRLVVTVRCMSEDFRDAADSNAVAAPVLVSIPLKGFWLKQRETKHITLSGSNQSLRHNFHLIKKIAVDLQYE